MRTIKFRGKRLDNGKWIEGCFAEFVHPIDGDTKPGIQVTRCVPSSIDRFIPVYETELVEVLPESVGQWTGLVDRHGKEIFEGDILSVYIGGTLQDNTYIVEDMCDLHLQMNREDSYYRMTSCRVIGNIHDNHELMEVE